MKSGKAKQAGTKIMESKHYHMGKADAYEGRVNCGAKRGSPEHMDYFRGFQEGLNEAYGCDEGLSENMAMTTPSPMTPAQPQMTTSTPAPTTPTSAPGSVPTAMSEDELDETMFLNELDKEDDMKSEIDALIDAALADELEDGEDLDEESPSEWIDKKKAEARAKGKNSVEVFGQNMPVDETADFMDIMESAIRRDTIMNTWNQQLAALLTESADCEECGMKDCECDHDDDHGKESNMKKKVSEGMTVTTTTGSQYGPDSVNINATDEDAHELMRILKHSGINVGLGDDDHHESETADFHDEESCDDETAGMMSVQEKPQASVMRLQPSDAVQFDDVIDAFGGRMGLSEAEEIAELLLLSGRNVMEAGVHPKGKGMSVTPTEHSTDLKVASQKETLKSIKPGKQKVSESSMEMPDGKGMSKNVKQKSIKPPQPTDQSAIMNTLKPEGTKKNNSLEGLQKSHDAGPAGKEAKVTSTESPNTPKAPPAIKKYGFENVSLSEHISRDLYKLYELSEDAAQTDVVSGYKHVDTMAMPRGMGMSVNVEDKPQQLIEPTDHDDIMKALDQGEPKPVKFPKLEKLLKNHMPDTEEPEIMPKQSEAETRKINGPIDSLKQGSTKSDYSNEIDEDGAKEDDNQKKVDEARETCSECGGYMEEDHTCEDTDKVQLEEWANDQGRHGTDEAELMNTEFITRTISGGLNGEKRDQTTLPHTEVKIRAGDDLGEWLRLSGLK